MVSGKGNFSTQVSSILTLGSMRKFIKQLFCRHQFRINNHYDNSISNYKKCPIKVICFYCNKEKTIIIKEHFLFNALARLMQVDIQPLPFNKKPIKVKQIKNK